MAITIRDVKVILTAPNGYNQVAVKVETSEPGLYGVGCATFTQRYLAVATAIREHIAPLVIGKEIDRITDLWNLMMVHGYWRNGPVVNNAVAGIDMALWDLKGKRAGMPVYELLGGKCREGALVYLHANGKNAEQLEDVIRAYRQAGVHHVRAQLVNATGLPYGGEPVGISKPEGALAGAYYDPHAYMRDNLRAMEHVRAAFGDGLEFTHDIHERLKPQDAITFAKECEKLRLFFLEDALAPEDNGWFENLRRACVTPLAMGELFCHPAEWTGLVSGRLIDFIRMHVTHIGGITPAVRVAALAEAFGVRTAWHGPGDLSGVGMTANVHLDLALPNFGIQEWSPWPDVLGDGKGHGRAMHEVYPGLPELRKGYLYVNDKPGLGVDIDEAAAAKYPCVNKVDTWTQARLPDGTITRP